MPPSPLSGALLPGPSKPDCRHGLDRHIFNSVNTLRQIAAASLWPPLALVLIGIGVYANALSAPFIFDDHPAIVENEDIREVLPLWRAPETSARSSINSRPLVRLSLALNYTYGALRVEGYHAVNLATHIACALALYGLMLRALGGRARERAPAFCAALLWLVHPLNSQIVNYVTQRSESLMALCYLGVLYCVHRRADGGSAGWSLAATVCCLLGVASKEVMVTAPVVAVLYDRAFICGSIADALRSRKGLYTGLAASWLLLAGLMASAPHGDSVGFSQSVGAYQYLLNQCVVITGYLGKFIWPAPLLIDYGAPRNLTLGNVLAPALLLLVLLAAALYLAWRRPQAGFCALFFFVVLAPTSSIVPLINEVGADRRMYLPLCALCALLLGGAWRLSPRLAGGGCLVAAVMLSALTIERNTTYQVPLALWQAEVAAADDNYRTQNNLGLALIDVGEFQTAIFHFRRAMELEPVFAVEANSHIAMAFNGLGAYPEAIAHYRRSLAEHPGYAPAHNNLGTTLLAIGDSTAARRSFRKALALDPQFALADNNLGALLVGAGDIDRARAHYERAIDVDPKNGRADVNLALLLESEGKIQEALWHYRRAVSVEPDLVIAHYNMGTVFEESGEPNDARLAYRRALALDPGFKKAHHRLGLLSATAGQLPEAMAHYRRALALDSVQAPVHFHLGRILVRVDSLAQGIAHYRRAVTLAPDLFEAHYNLGTLLLRLGHAGEALTHLRQVVRLRPDMAAAHNNLAIALQSAGQFTEAVAEFRRALALRPDDAEVQANLARILARVEASADLSPNSQSP